MKRIISLLLMTAVLVGCQGEKPAVEQKTATVAAVAGPMQKQLGSLLMPYFELKNALVAGDAAAATQKAAAMQTAMTTIDVASLSGDLATKWSTHSAQLAEALAAQVSSSDLAKQRSAFLPLSRSLIASVKAFGPLEKPVYVQYCPMAFDNSGGDWLSASEEVFNPYFGDAMLHCGTVKETIAAN